MRHVDLGASWPHQQPAPHHPYAHHPASAGPGPMRVDLELRQDRTACHSLPAGPLWALPSKPPQRPLKPGIAREPPDEPAALPVSWPTRRMPARLHSAAAGVAPSRRPFQDTRPRRGPGRPTFSFCPFLFFPRPWRLLDLVPELLLLTAGLGWVFFLPSTFLRLPAKRTPWVCASRVPMASPKGAPAKAPLGVFNGKINCSLEALPPTEGGRWPCTARPGLEKNRRPRPS